MTRALAIAGALALAGGVASAKPTKVLGGVVTVDLPRGWQVEGSKLVKKRGAGEVSVDLLITTQPLRQLAKGFREDAFDGIGDSSVRNGKVGGVDGLIATAGTDDQGAILEGVESCLGTITVRTAWFSDEDPAERAQLRAIVKSVRIRVAGGGFRDDDAAIDPGARALADKVVDALCADDVRAIVALATPSVRIRDASHRDLTRDTLRGEMLQVHGPRAYAAMPAGPFSLAARDDGSVDLLTIAAPPAGADDTGYVTLRKVNGAWMIAGIARTLESPP